MPIGGGLQPPPPPPLATLLNRCDYSDIQEGRSQAMYKLQRDITPLVCLGKVYVKCLERKCREIVESKLEDGQCGFRPGRCTTDQIFTLKQIFEKSWEYGKDLFACFVDLEKAYDRVPRDKLWKVLQEYGVNGQLLRAITSFYCKPEVCVRVNGKQSKPFHVGPWTPARVRFATSPFHCLHELDRQMQPS